MRKFGELIVCPVDDWSCPYYKDGACIMETEEGVPPYEECDAFYDYKESEEEEDE